MELWIRSQDKKKLCNAKSFELDNDETGIFCNNYEDAYIFAGKYKTKERALEVLDEIQQYLTPKIELLDEKLNGKQVCQIGNILTMVYEMPKE